MILVLFWLRMLSKVNENTHYSLDDSATEPFSPHWRSDKTNNLMPSDMHNSGSRIRWRINLKGKNEVKSGTSEEQY